MRSKDVGEQNKFKILQCLAAGDADGKSTSTVSREIALHRDTVHSLCRERVAAGLVVKGSGKWGKFRLTEKAIGDPSLLGWAFSRRAFKEILRRGDASSSGCKYSKLDFKDVSKITDREFERRLLFNSALLIGAYVLYVFLKSFKPTDIEPPPTINRRQRKIKMTGRHKHKLSSQWVKNAIQPYAMLTELRKENFIKQYLKPYSGSDDRSWSFNEITSEQSYNRLMSEFGEVFDGVYRVLQKEVEKAVPIRDWYTVHYSESISAASSAKTRKEEKKNNGSDGTSGSSSPVISS
jgi:hypothetical protein